MLSSLKGEQGHHLKLPAHQGRECSILNQEPKKQRLQLLLELCHCPKSHWSQLIPLPAWSSKLHQHKVTALLCNHGHLTFTIAFSKAQATPGDLLLALIQSSSLISPASSRLCACALQSKPGQEQMHPLSSAHLMSFWTAGSRASLIILGVPESPCF